jgi:phosphoadenosine phosphosulfate reductase
MDIAKERRAIEYLKAFEPQTEPYYLCYSGGKDSDVIRILASLAGVKHDIVNRHTTVDAPETVRYIRSIPNVQIIYPELTMWQLIQKKLMPPTRRVRYCCSDLKENGGKGRVKITGVRKAESAARAKNGGVVKVIGRPKSTIKLAEEMELEYDNTEKGGIVLNLDNDASRRFVESCYRTTTTLVNPIIDWSDGDVWKFLGYYGCASNPLYYCGFSRIGCIGCPLGCYKARKREFALYPKYQEAYIRAFDKMIDRRIERELPTVWKSGEECFTWWIGDDPNQLSFFDEYDEEWYLH